MKIFNPVIFLLLSSTVFAQTVEQKLAKFESPKFYIATHDKFKDVTTIRFASAVTLNPKGKTMLGIGFSMYLTYEGTDPDKGSQYWLTFMSAGLGGPGRSLKTESVIFLADGDKVTLQGPTLDRSTRPGFMVQTMFIENASFPISRADLKTLADAQKVEFQVYGAEGMLDKKSLAALDNMLSLTK